MNLIPETLPVNFTGDQLYHMVKLYDLLRDMDFELTPLQESVFEKIQCVQSYSVYQGA